ncbi:pantoate--beta-alanine ligase [Porticoccus sp. W117]|uniref:pantoate--beta-alanine ligase n=1 Tax=Porticoccus sp. W117 TaxID=3054777 RepID=UPI002593390D|nr:pantoate--beta-alanine ligase [Porticoccus sp. W117]MDM3871357.1 pantoate--beta-alanine ligase [Porticoccus sp. W117]
MKLFHTVQGIRDAVSASRRDGKRIGFVPTMGNLHEGHLQLVRLARETCDVVVVSIFVNPLQFGLNEDWETYPRTLQSDAEKLESVGCDYLFHPTEGEIYPNGMADQTRVVVPTMTDILCGASRPGHFEGVTTVVSKLFHIVQPDEAVFGIKDYQQLAVIRRMTEDLCIPVEVIAAPIARDHDGLALSSRNSFISEDERPKADVLYRTLCWVKEQITAGERDFMRLQDEANQRIEAEGFRPDYLEICHAKTLEPAACDDTEIVVLGAMYARNARLIDNVTVSL